MRPSSSGLLAPHLELIAGACLRSKPADGLQRATKFAGGASERRLIVAIAHAASSRAANRPALLRDIRKRASAGHLGRARRRGRSRLRSAPSTRKQQRSETGWHCHSCLKAAASPRRVGSLPRALFRSSRQPVRGPGRNDVRPRAPAAPRSRAQITRILRTMLRFRPTDGPTFRRKSCVSVQTEEYAWSALASLSPGQPCHADLEGSPFKGRQTLCLHHTLAGV
jgi:hypothetical protein